MFASWERACLAAAQHAANSDEPPLLGLWQEAGTLSAAFPAGDPRRAASLNNMAVAEALAGRVGLAEAGLRAALDAWHEVKGWIETLKFAGAGRSSTFHFRLEQQHREELQDVVRGRYLELSDGGAAASDFALSALQALSGQSAAGRASMIGAARRRRTALGESDPLARQMLEFTELPPEPHRALQVAVLIDNPGPSPYWARAERTQSSGERHLLAAVHLSASLGIRHGIAAR